MRDEQATTTKSKVSRSISFTWIGPLSQAMQSSAMYTLEKMSASNRNWKMLCIRCSSHHSALLLLDSIVIFMQTFNRMHSNDKTYTTQTHIHKHIFSEWTERIDVDYRSAGSSGNQSLGLHTYRMIETSRLDGIYPENKILSINRYPIRWANWIIGCKYECRYHWWENGECMENFSNIPYYSGWDALFEIAEIVRRNGNFVAHSIHSIFSNVSNAMDVVVRQCARW